MSKTLDFYEKCSVFTGLITGLVRFGIAHLSDRFCVVWSICGKCGKRKILVIVLLGSLHQIQLNYLCQLS